MNGEIIPNDVTQEFFEMSGAELRRHIASLGTVAVCVSFCLPEQSDDQNMLLLRKVKAFLEMGINRAAAVIATEEQVWIEPNAFSSGIIRVGPLE